MVVIVIHLPGEKGLNAEKHRDRGHRSLAEAGEGKERQSEVSAALDVSTIIELIPAAKIQLA